MEKIILSEQDIINSVCLFHAKYQNVSPENVEVELMYDDESGYMADAYVNGQKEHYNTTNLIMAIRLYIDEQLHQDSLSARIQLQLHDTEGIIAQLEW